MIRNEGWTPSIPDYTGKTVIIPYIMRLLPPPRFLIPYSCERICLPLRMLTTDHWQLATGICRASSPANSNLLLPRQNCFYLLPVRVQRAAAHVVVQQQTACLQGFEQGRGEGLFQRGILYVYV